MPLSAPTTTSRAPTNTTNAPSSSSSSSSSTLPSRATHPLTTANLLAHTTLTTPHTHHSADPALLPARTPLTPTHPPIRAPPNTLATLFRPAPLPPTQHHGLTPPQPQQPQLLLPLTADREAYAAEQAVREEEVRRREEGYVVALEEMRNGPRREVERRREMREWMERLRGRVSRWMDAVEDSKEKEEGKGDGKGREEKEKERQQ